MKTSHCLIVLVLLASLLVAGCGSGDRVGELRTESQSVELDDAASVQVDITLGAGSLKLAGDAEKLLEADFAYNVARLKPEVTYSRGRLAVREPDNQGMPDLRGLPGFRNEWDLHLHRETPMALRVDMGGGSGDLNLAGLALTDLAASFGAGDYMVDLTGDWSRDVEAEIDAGAADIRLRLPNEVGVRVEVEAGPHTIDASGLSRQGNVYANAAYGVSPVTLRVNLDVGVGTITLEEDGS